MKKLMLSMLFLSLMSIVCAQAPMKISAERFNIKYCGNEVADWVKFSPAEASKVTVYIEVTAEQATLMAGHKFTGITFSTAVGEDYTQNLSLTASGSIFVTEDLAGQPAASMKTSINNSYGVADKKQSAQFSRNKQYVIKENTPFYFGYTVELTNEPVWIGYDRNLPNENFSGTIVVEKTDGTTQTIEGKDLFADNNGRYHNAMLFGYVDGAATTPGSLGFGKFTFGTWYEPAFDLEHLRPIQIDYENSGSEEVTEIEYSYWFDIDAELRTATAQVSIAPGETGVLELPLELVPGRINVFVSIDKVNGAPCKHLGAAYAFYLGDKGYPAKFVIEEYAGQSCGYCPKGLWAFEWFKRNFPDDFIGISVMNYSNDRFTCETYKPLMQLCTAAPQCFVNRLPEYSAISFDRELLEKVYNTWRGQMSNGNIELQVATSFSSITVKSRANFAVDDEHDYIIAYVLMEDGLEGMQLNNYSGVTIDRRNVCGDWKDRDSYAPWTYENVAREVKDPWGYEPSAIHAPRAGEVYECTLTFSRSSLYNRDPKQGYIYALLIDQTNGGEVISCFSQALVAGGNTGGIEGIDLEEAPATYYNLQGMPVANPVPGTIYIKQENGTSSKVAF